MATVLSYQIILLSSLTVATRKNLKQETVFRVKFVKCILKVNPRSIRKHLSDLGKLVFDLENQTVVVFLSETGLTDKDKVRNKLLPDYDELDLFNRDKHAEGDYLLTLISALTLEKKLYIYRMMQIWLLSSPTKPFGSKWSVCPMKIFKKRRNTNWFCNRLENENKKKELENFGDKNKILRLW